MVVCSVDLKMTHFTDLKRMKNYLVLKYHTSMQLGGLCTLLTILPDIAFLVNLLAKYSFNPTRRHWNGNKHILCYIFGATYMLVLLKATKAKIDKICRCKIPLKST